MQPALESVQFSLAGAQLSSRTLYRGLEVAELLLMIGQYISLGRMLVMIGGHKGACEIYVPDF